MSQYLRMDFDILQLVRKKISEPSTGTSHNKLSTINYQPWLDFLGFQTNQLEFWSLAHATVDPLKSRLSSDHFGAPGCSAGIWRMKYFPVIFRDYFIRHENDGPPTRIGSRSRSHRGFGFRSSQSVSKKDRRQKGNSKGDGPFFRFARSLLRGTIFFPGGFRKSHVSWLVGIFSLRGFSREKRVPDSWPYALPTTPIKTSDYPQQPPGRSEGQGGG